MSAALSWLVAVSSALAGDPLLPVDTALPSGLVVRTIEDPSLPLVSVLLMVPGGSIHDPADRLGTADLTARLLPEGTTAHDALALAGALEDLGTRLDVSAGAAFTTLSASFLAEDWIAGLDLVAEVATSPRLTARDLRAEKARALQELAVDLDDAQSVASRVTYQELFGEHPFGRPESGTAASLARVTARDLRAFHAAQYRPRGAVLCVVGDVRVAQVQAAAEAAFAGWEGQAADPGLPPLPDPWSGVQKVLVDLPGQSQVQVRIAHRAVPRAHPEHEALRLGSALLGGGFTSRLMDLLRVQHALTYGADSSLWSFDREAVLSADFSTGNESAREALELAWGAIQGWRAGGWGDEEFDRARAYTLGMVPQVLETRAARAWTLAVMDYQGLPADHMARRVSTIEALERPGVEAAVARAFTGDGWLVVVVGDLDVVRPQLEGFLGGTWEVVAAR
jgi:zinc protease